MAEHRLMIPETILEDINRMRYTGMETLDYYLSLEVNNSSGISTLMLCRIPGAEPTPAMRIETDPEARKILSRYLSANQNHSAVFLHSHPLEGPSRGYNSDESSMMENFRVCDRLRYIIIVGPNGPRFYETDGTSVFPIRAPVQVTRDVEKVTDLQLRVAQEYERITAV